MARAKPVTPAGEGERALLEAVEKPPYLGIAAFSRAVAKETGRQPVSEKSSFYRIVRNGSRSPMAITRREVYARLLNDPAAPWLVTREREAAAAPDEGQTRVHLQELASSISMLLEQQARMNRTIQRLQARVRKLENPPSPPADVARGPAG